MSDSEGRCIERRSVDLKKACRKWLVVPQEGSPLSLARSIDHCKKSLGGCIALAIRMPLLIFVLLQPSLNIRLNYPKPRLFVFSVGPGNQRCHGAM